MLKQGKKVCKTTAVQCYPCFSLRSLLFLASRAKWLIPNNCYSGKLLTAADRCKRLPSRGSILSPPLEFGTHIHDSIFSFIYRSSLMFQDKIFSKNPIVANFSLDFFKLFGKSGVTANTGLRQNCD